MTLYDSYMESGSICSLTGIVGGHLVCIQMSVQIIAIANEPPSAILLILLTRGVNCCCTKAMRAVWGHHISAMLMYNTLNCKQFMFNSSCEYTKLNLKPYAFAPVYDQYHIFDQQIACSIHISHQ